MALGRAPTNRTDRTPPIAGFAARIAANLACQNALGRVTPGTGADKDKSRHAQRRENQSVRRVRHGVAKTIATVRRREFRSRLVNYEQDRS